MVDAKISANKQQDIYIVLGFSLKSITTYKGEIIVLQRRNMADITSPKWSKLILLLLGQK